MLTNSLSDENCFNNPDYEFLAPSGKIQEMFIHRKKTLLGVWYYGYTSELNQSLPDLACFCSNTKKNFVVKNQRNEKLFDVKAYGSTFCITFNNKTCAAIRFKSSFNVPTIGTLILPNVITKQLVPCWSNNLSKKQVKYLIKNENYPGSIIYHGKIPVKTDDRIYYHLPFSQDHGVASVKNLVIIDSRGDTVFEFLRQKVLSNDKKYQIRGKQINQFGIMYNSPISPAIAFAIAVARCRF